MTDKLLKEAFDKLSQIEESEVDHNTVALVYKTMDHYMDTVESMRVRLEDGLVGRQMEEMGLTGERAALIQKLSALHEEFFDFMPGLEMEYRGEN